MKINYLGISVILMMAVVLAMSGCSGGNTGGQATPTATPAPTGGAPGAASMFDMDKLKFYEWKVTSLEGGQTKVTYFRFERGPGTYNGVPANEEKMTITAEGSDVMMFDIFYNPTDHTQLGGKMKLGEMEIDMPADGNNQYSGMFDSYNVADSYQTNDWPMLNKGSETLTINGKTYVCSKYWAGTAGEYGTLWVANSVPMPVKIESKSAGNTWTYELWDWGA